MYLPKPDVYQALNDIDATVMQGMQKTVTDFPSITFYVDDNAASLNLDNEIAWQNVSIIVDVWAHTSQEADSLLAQVETKMRELGYRLATMSDVPDPKNICHINTRFEAIKT